MRFCRILFVLLSEQRRQNGFFCPVSCSARFLFHCCSSSKPRSSPPNCSEPLITGPYPSRLLEKAVQELTRLPGVGRKTALRYALYLLRQSPEVVHSFAQSLTDLRDHVSHCKICHNLSDHDICDICAANNRDRTQVCVVENVHSVMCIEQTGQYNGLYHVLGGIISPMDGIGPSDIELASLINRAEEGEIKEVILALSPTMEGDTTNFYISRRLAHLDLKISVIARGVSVGDGLEYTDEVTLGRSILGRTPLQS